jgi:Fur family zinc uptake transcriptional regulator
MRRQVLAVLVDSHRSLGAYDIIDILASDGGKRLAPISIYRALDFLVDAGLAHKLESRNAFVACPHLHGQGEHVVFMICDACGRVQEAVSNDVSRNLAEVATRYGFRPRGQVIEMAGTCAGCAQPVTA